MQPGISSNTDTGHSGDLPMMVAINEEIKDVARFIDWFSQLKVGTSLQGRSRA